MNTPAHAVVNLAILGRKDRPGLVAPVLIGAVLPDLVIVGFYILEKTLRGASEETIWSQMYYSPGWQAVFDSFHSLPLVLAGLAVAALCRAPRAAALCASMGLHALEDLPLHSEDAHRHFFPLSDWRFMSPVSYWDPRHHGGIGAPLEAAAVLTGLLVLARRHESLRARGITFCLAVVYVLYLAFALWAWRIA